MNKIYFKLKEINVHNNNSKDHIFHISGKLDDNVFSFTDNNNNIHKLIFNKNTFEAEKNGIRNLYDPKQKTTHNLVDINGNKISVQVVTKDYHLSEDDNNIHSRVTYDIYKDNNLVSEHELKIDITK